MGHRAIIMQDLVVVLRHVVVSGFSRTVAHASVTGRSA